MYFCVKYFWSWKSEILLMNSFKALTISKLDDKLNLQNIWWLIVSAGQIRRYSLKSQRMRSAMQTNVQWAKCKVINDQKVEQTKQ